MTWVASAYGFGHDLAYFRQIFGEFVSRFPDTVIHVTKNYPVDEYPELPLRADFEFVSTEQRRTIGDGIPYGGPLRLPTLGTIWRILRDPAQVFIIIEFTPTALIGWLAARVRRKRVMLLVECDPIFRGVSPKRLVTAVKRLVAMSCHSVLTSNEHGRRYLRDVVKLPEARITVGPYLTSDPGAQPSGTHPRPDRIRFLFLNTVSQRKGICQLIDALAETPVEFRDRWALKVVGSGDQDDLVRGLVDRHDLNANVSFHARVPHSEVPRFYADADIVVCPTLGDYRSLAGIEAVNAGRGVVVSTRDGATEEISQYAAAAWQVDPLDGPGFAKTMTELVSDPQAVAVRLGAAQTPPPEFSLAVVGDNLERAVARALA